MARFLLDTNICIHIRQVRLLQVVTRFRTLDTGAASMSVITYGELRYGAEKSAVRERALAMLTELVNVIPVEPIPPSAGAVYGAVRAELERRGAMIGNHDLWIAAHALAADLTLVTSNEREFRRVPGLKVENWAAG